MSANLISFLRFLQYPAYLALARSTLPPADLERYEKQYAVVVSIVQKFEEPGADKPLEQQTEQEKALSQERTDEVVELVAKMNEYGAPPKQLMGEMPAGESFPFFALLFRAHLLG